jgi:cysteine desulfurase / selenocysteine lyase
LSATAQATDAAGLAVAVSADFPLLERTIDGIPVTYLDSAATSLKPRAVIDAVVGYYTTVGANIHRGKHMLSEEASDEYERVRAETARTFGCQTHEIVFAANATHALNLLATGLDLQPDDLVLCQLDSHHSNLLPWAAAAEVRIVDADAEGRIDLESFTRLLEEEPRVVSLTHCSNVTGVVTPIRDLARLAQAAGAVVVVDAAQSAPHRRLPLADLEADFVAFSGHKMLGPTGVGVLYVRGAQLERLRPAQLGGGTVDWVELDGHVLRKAPHRFEAGTPNVSGIYGFGAALRYLERTGWDLVERHDRLMAEALTQEASQRPYLRMLAAGSEDRAGIAGLRIRGTKHLGEIARALSDSHGVMCRSGHMCAQPFVDRIAQGEVLRLSTYLYNSVEDVARAFAALDATCASFGVEVTRD